MASFGVNDNTNPFNSFQGLQLQTSDRTKELSKEAQGIEADKKNGLGLKPSVFATNPVQAPKNAPNDHDILTDKIGNDNGQKSIVGDAYNAMGVTLNSTNNSSGQNDSAPSNLKGGLKIDSSTKTNELGEIVHTNTKYDEKGNTVSGKIRTIAKDGSSHDKGFENNFDGSVTDTEKNFDANGNLTKSEITTTAKDGSKETVLKKINSDGSYTSTITKPDGKIVKSEFKKNEKGQFEKTSEKNYEEGSLSDINEQKKDIIKDKKEEAKKNLENGSDKVTERASNKYKELSAEQKENDAKIAKLDPVKDKEKIADLQKRQEHLKNRQSSLVDKTAKKSLRKDEDYKELKKEEQTMQANLNGVDLKDKDGHKLTDKEKANMNVFDKDGNVLDKDTLAEKGIKKSYNINADPNKVLAADDATDAEKYMAVTNIALQRAQGLQNPNNQQQQTTMGTIAAALGRFSDGFNNANNQQQYQQPQQYQQSQFNSFVPASRRNK